jgi:hypothetical protein
MAAIETLLPERFQVAYLQWMRDVQLGVQNLMLHGLRSLLTMLGMIFGVAAVVAMLSIGAGARQKVMALIEQMGVHNLIVEAKETTELQAHQKVRKISPGLTLQDYRIILDDVEGIVDATPRKRLTPQKILPKSQRDMPVVFGVNPTYQRIAGLTVLSGVFFSQSEDDQGAPVCVLGRQMESLRSRKPHRPVRQSERAVAERNRRGRPPAQFSGRLILLFLKRRQQQHLYSTQIFHAPP